MTDRIAAYPDGTQLVVLGPDTSENGITWKHVRAPDGRVGYVPAQYTVPELPTTATVEPSATVTPSTVTAGPTVAPLPVIAAKTLARAYETDKTTADHKYKERQFRITGTISSTSTFLGKRIALADGDVSCSVDDQHAHNFSSLRAGQQVTLQGKIAGKSLFTAIRVEDCIVLPAITVYVGNTGADGVSLRRTRNLADRIAAYRDNTKLVVLGPDTLENGITWKHVRAPDGKVGYVPAQYTVPKLPATPTAVPTPTAPPRQAPRDASSREVKVPSSFVLCEQLRAHKSMLWGQAPSLIYSGDPRVSGRIQPGDYIRILMPWSDSNGRVRVMVYSHDHRTVGQTDGKVWIDWWGLAHSNLEHAMFKCEDA